MERALTPDIVVVPSGGLPMSLTAELQDNTKQREKANEKQLVDTVLHSMGLWGNDDRTTH